MNAQDFTSFLGLLNEEILTCKIIESQAQINEIYRKNLKKYNENQQESNTH